jgi:uncharacterized protein
MRHDNSLEMSSTRGSALQVVILLAAALGIFLNPVTAYAQAPAAAPVKVALIRRVLELTQAGDLAVRAMEAAIAAQRAARPQIPNEFWDELAARAHRETPQLVDMLVPIYDAQFTAAELKELIRFYQSPVGRHVSEMQPVIAVQGARAGQRWGAKLGAEVAQDLARRKIQMPPP